jgi:carboxyl-terminal processing protease
LSSISQSLVSKLLIFDYATLYRRNHTAIAPAKNFMITEQDYNDFLTFISDKEYDYTTKSEKTLDELKEISEKEKYFDAVKAEYEALKKKMMHDKQADLVKFKEEIMTLLQDEIVSRYYYQSGRVEASFNNDPDIRKAIEALKDKAIYAAIFNRTLSEKN